MSIPTRKNSGIAGTQSSVVPTGTIEICSPFKAGYGNVVEGLAVSDPRSFGGKNAAQLLTTIVQHQDTDLLQTRMELRESQSKVLELTEKLADAKGEVGALNARLTLQERGARVEYFTALIGAALFGVGVDLFKSGQSTPGCLVGACGVALAVVGWRWKSAGSK